MRLMNRDDSIVYLSPAKINWFLHVTGMRDDGYHLIETVFQKINWFDELRITTRDDALIVLSGDLSGVAEKQNLAYKAADILRKEAGLSNLGAAVHLVKNIPTGAGLGGGSSNAATVLLALNQLWELNFNNQELQKIGLTLGADVPFFVSELNAAFASGVGEMLRAVDLSGHDLLLVNPNIHISTAAIFSHPDLFCAHESVEDNFIELLQQIQSGSNSLLTNDLEKSTFALKEDIAFVYHTLRAVVPNAWVRMSGSGATIFAVPQNDIEKDALLYWQRNEAPNYWKCRWAQTIKSCVAL